MIAIILNSGRGSRLGKYTEEIPKCMVDIGEGETIISRQLTILKQCGIEKIIITTGYLQDLLIDYVKRLYIGLNISYCYNDEYMVTNYIESLNRVPFINEDCLLLHGDLIFDKDILDDIIAFSGSCIIADSSAPLPEKDFKARVNNGNVKKIGVDVFGEDAVSVQPLYKLTTADWKLWKERIALFCKQGIKNVYAENALNEVLDVIDLQMVEVNAKFCGEIDNEEDLLKYTR